MLLFKYFEKRAKYGLPDPNGPLSSRVPSDESIGQPRAGKVSGGSRSSYLLSRLAASEGKKSGPYNRFSYNSYSAFYACNPSWIAL